MAFTRILFLWLSMKEDQIPCKTVAPCRSGALSSPVGQGAGIKVTGVMCTATVHEVSIALPNAGL